MSNQKRIDFKLHDKAIIKICVECFHGYWKRRRVALIEPEVQRKVSQDEVLAIVEEVRKEEVVGSRRHAEVCGLNVSEALVKEMV